VRPHLQARPCDDDDDAAALVILILTQLCQHLIISHLQGYTVYGKGVAGVFPLLLHRPREARRADSASCLTLVGVAIKALLCMISGSLCTVNQLII
jgi:hypothetical protein